MSRPTQVVWWPYCGKKSAKHSEWNSKFVSSLRYEDMEPAYAYIFTCETERRAYPNRMHVTIAFDSTQMCTKQNNMKFTMKWKMGNYLHLNLVSVCLCAVEYEHSVSNERQSCVSHARSTQPMLTHTHTHFMSKLFIHCVWCASHTFRWCIIPEMVYKSQGEKETGKLTEFIMAWISLVASVLLFILNPLN